MEEQKIYNRGFYTGAFDIIHRGHLAALELAKQHCKELVVGVSTDEVIREYKHHKPAQPYEDRATIVSALKCVDYVVPQNDLYNKLEMCLKLGCDVLFSSDEYQRKTYKGRENEMTPKEIAGVERWERFENEVNEYGIDVVYLPRTQGISSTQAKEDIASSIGYQQPQGIMLYNEGENIDENNLVM